MQRGIVAAVSELVGPLLAPLGIDLVLVEFVGPGRVLRLYIDREAGVGLDDCATVSRLVGDVLDAEAADGPLGQGHYTLEVSSPGLDRPLVRPEHYRRFVGSTVRVVTKAPTGDGGRRNLTGRLQAADATAIRVEAAGEQFVLAYDAIDRARLVPELPG